MKIADKKFVTVQYKLHVKNENGEMELMEQTTPENPLRFLYGMGLMLPAFEAQLKDMDSGSEFDFMLPCEDAYGKYDEESVIDLPKNIFENSEGELDDSQVYADAIVPLRDAQGNVFNARVVEVKDDVVKVDFNHPLANEDLYFSGKVIAVQDASDEEIDEALNPHGHSCGCGSDSCGCGDDSCGCGSSDDSCGCGGGSCGCN